MIYRNNGGSRYAPLFYPITIPLGIIVSAVIGAYALITLGATKLRERRESALEKKAVRQIFSRDN